MTINIQWHEPNLIMLAEYVGTVTLEELQASVEQLLHTVEEYDHPLHFIFDVRQLDRLPMIQLNNMPVLMRFLRHERLGWIGVIGMHSAVAFWLKVFIKLIGLRYAHFNTLKEADQFLREVDRIESMPVS